MSFNYMYIYVYIYVYMYIHMCLNKMPVPSIETAFKLYYQGQPSQIPQYGH